MERNLKNVQLRHWFPSTLSLSNSKNISIRRKIFKRFVLRDSLYELSMGSDLYLYHPQGKYSESELCFYTTLDMQNKINSSKNTGAKDKSINII